MDCTIINPALSLLMKHLVIGQRQKSPNFSAFHWSPHGSLVSIGQHFVAMRVVHLPKRTETSLITESDGADLITESDQAVRAVHSCNIWFLHHIRASPSTRPERVYDRINTLIRLEDFLKVDIKYHYLR